MTPIKQEERINILKVLIDCVEDVVYYPSEGETWSDGFEKTLRRKLEIAEIEEEQTQ